MQLQLYKNRGSKFIDILFFLELILREEEKKHNN